MKEKGISRISVAVYPRYSPLTPSERIVCLRRKSDERPGAACARCFTTSTGTRIPHATVSPNAADALTDHWLSGRICFPDSYTTKNRAADGTEPTDADPSPE